jgi:hypothetical protein
LNARKAESLVNPRRRFWIELGLAVLSGLLLVLTLMRRDWIESLFGVDPDRIDGSVEWAFEFVLVIATVTFSLFARLEWFRASYAAHRTQHRTRRTDWPSAE